MSGHGGGGRSSRRWGEAYKHWRWYHYGWHPGRKFRGRLPERMMRERERRDLADYMRWRERGGLKRLEAVGVDDCIARLVIGDLAELDISESVGLQAERARAARDEAIIQTVVPALREALAKEFRDHLAALGASNLMPVMGVPVDSFDLPLGAETDTAGDHPPTPPNHRQDAGLGEGEGAEENARVIADVQAGPLYRDTGENG